MTALVLDGVLLLTGDGAPTWGAGARDALVLLAGGFAVAGGGALHHRHVPVRAVGGDLRGSDAVVIRPASPTATGRRE
jgi:hypothetical protein